MSATDAPTGRHAGVNPRILQALALLESTVSLGFSDPVNTLLDAYEAAQVNEARLKHSTIAEYSRALTVFRGLFAGLSVGDMSADVILSKMDSVPRGSRPSFFSVLSAALRWGDRHGWRGVADAIPDRRPKSRARSMALTDAQYEELGAAIDAADAFSRMRGQTIDAIRFGIVTPVRLGELVSLRHDEVDTFGRVIRLVDTKVGDRIVPLSPVAASILQRQPRRGPFVFTKQGAPHRHIQGSGVSHAFKRIVKTCSPGMRGLVFHSLRHSWASKAIRDGAPMEIVRRILGHSSEHMSARYVHLHNDALRSVSDSIESAIAKFLQIELPIHTQAKPKGEK